MRKKDYSQYANQVFSKTCELDNCTLKKFTTFSGNSQFTQKMSIFKSEFILICIITMALMNISITHSRMSIIKIEKNNVYSNSHIQHLLFVLFFRVANIYARERLRFKQKTFKNLWENFKFSRKRHWTDGARWKRKNFNCLQYFCLTFSQRVYLFSEKNQK